MNAPTDNIDLQAPAGAALQVSARSVDRRDLSDRLMGIVAGIKCAAYTIAFQSDGLPAELEVNFSDAEGLLLKLAADLSAIDDDLFARGRGDARTEARTSMCE